MKIEFIFPTDKVAKPYVNKLLNLGFKATSTRHGYLGKEVLYLSLPVYQFGVFFVILRMVMAGLEIEK